MLNSHLGGRVRIPKTAEVLASRIRKAIIRGELKAGDRLPPEVALSADFEVSRPTIREAIRILESEALITVSRGAGGGARVNALSNDLVTRAAGVALQARGATIGDIYAARCAVEPPAARHAAEHRSDLASAALRAHLERERVTFEEPLAFATALADFHRVLLEECGNAAFAVMGVALQDIVERHMRLGVRQPQSPYGAQTSRVRQLALRSHERLIELIEQGEGEKAEAQWAEHMRVAAKGWLTNFEATSVIDILE